ncbi:MAG: HNH endonuclease [Rhodanobacter sp.]
MALDAADLATRVSVETGLDFVGAGGRNADGSQTYQLQPSHHPAANTFTLQTLVGWRNIEVVFTPGSFSAELLEAMGLAEPTGRAAFVAVLGSSREHGAQVTLSLNNRERDFDDPTLWDVPWQNARLTLRKGMLPINDGDTVADAELIGSWVARLAAAILALLPLEADEADEQIYPDETIFGLPEGAKVSLVVNRYERDRRNRAAALAIHGHICKACASDMGRRYGATAAGLIEVHHTTPVSRLGPGYVIDPRTDLVPLCPNCHAVAHRRNPPYSVEELQSLLRALPSEVHPEDATPATGATVHD